MGGIATALELCGLKSMLHPGRFRRLISSILFESGVRSYEDVRLAVQRLGLHKVGQIGQLPSAAEAEAAAVRTVCAWD